MALPYTVALLLVVLVLPATAISNHDQHGSLEVKKGLASEADAQEHTFVELNIGAHGRIVRRDESSIASLTEADAAHLASTKSKEEPAAASDEDPDKPKSDEPADVTQDGAVTVVSPAGTSSEQVKLEELTEECMQEEPTAECMEKFGSYGIRKLYTEDWDSIRKLGQTRNGWMSHPVVQKRRLFDLTLPGTVNSGTYAINGDNGPAAAIAPYGVISQNLNLYHQLELGIRMFDLKVGYSKENELVYISHGALMVPISTAMKDIRRYLEEHVRDVVVLDVAKDPYGDPAHQKPLLDEEKDVKRIPGQLVHEAIACELKEMVATYAVLSKLPDNELAENPTVGALTEVGAQIIYLWEGQQVLCTTFQECSLTPGWYPPDRQAGARSGDLSFGQPFALGTRKNSTGAKDTSRIIEPMCNAHSGAFTKDDQPEVLMKKMKDFSMDLLGSIEKKLPKCFPLGAKLPTEHNPTIWYTLDAWVTPTEAETNVQTERMRGVKAIYTRGEGFTVKSEAERTNYLLMAWYLKRHGQAIFTKPNAIMLEFASAGMMPIIRIIEAMQARPECGWAIFCKDSGSCWADTLLGDKDECADEELVVKKLKDHAEGVEDTTSWIMWFTACIVAVTILCMISCCTKYILKLVKGPEKPKDAALAEAKAEVQDRADARAGAGASSS